MSRSRPSDALREATYPPPYPDGWYCVAASRELRPGALKYVECLGKQLVVFRSEDGGSVHALSAFCLHMGANLADGRVCGQRVECPFHRWQIGGDGRVGHIPYSDKLPAHARQESFPIRELYGQVFIYHRGGGAPARCAPRSVTRGSTGSPSRPPTWRSSSRAPRCSTDCS